jgi:5,10-methylenetetrahydromethanopterin reductase
MIPPYFEVIILMKKHELSIGFQTDKRAQEYIDLAKLVNDYDFDAVTVYCDTPFHPSYPPLMLMAQHITRARIGTAGVQPSRMHPVDIASQAALLDDLAQGGTYIGMVRGAWLAEHGIKEVKPAVPAMRETVEIIRYMLSGELGGYQGEVYQIAEHVRAPYHLPDHDIPILIGTWGKKLAAVAGELADELKIGGSANPDVIPVIVDYLAVGEAKAGREKGSVGIVIGAVSVIDEDRDQARLMARQSVALYMPIVAKLDPTVEIDPELMARVQDHVNAGESDEAAKLIPDDILERFAFAGNANDIIRQCEQLFDAGAHRVELGTPHGVNQSATGIHIVGKQVIPALKAYLGD